MLRKGVRGAQQAGSAFDERKPLVRVSAVERDEELGRVRKSDHRRGDEDELRHDLDVVDGQVVVQTKDGARDDHQRQHGPDDSMRENLERRDRAHELEIDRDNASYKFFDFPKNYR